MVNGKALYIMIYNGKISSPMVNGKALYIMIYNGKVKLTNGEW